LTIRKYAVDYELKSVKEAIEYLEDNADEPEETDEESEEEGELSDELFNEGIATYVLENMFRQNV
jgi:hypothetical protein